MELRQFRQFIAVAEELHFARAAERLGMEQSPLSRAIRDLEAELKVRLFHRTTRRTWLTQSGQRFLDGARRVLSDVEAAVASTRGGVGAGNLKLHLGLAEHAAGEIFARLLMELTHCTPPIRAELRELTPSEVLRQIDDGGLDLGLLLEQRFVRGLRCELAWSEPLVLVLPFNHPLAAREQVSIGEADNEAFVLPLPEATPGLAKQVRHFLASHNVCPARIIHAAHQNSMLSLIAIGLGIGIMAEPFTRGLTEVTVVPLVDADAIVTTWLLYREDDPSEAVVIAVALAGSVALGGKGKLV